MDKTQFIYLFFGYLVALLGVLIYVASLVLGERKLREELALLEQQIKDSEGR